MIELDRIQYDRELFRMNEGLGSASHFGGMLYRLIAKADLNNLNRLRRAFPLEVFVYDTYARGVEWAEGAAANGPSDQIIALTADLREELMHPELFGQNRIDLILNRMLDVKRQEVMG